MRVGWDSLKMSEYILIRVREVLENMFGDYNGVKFFYVL